jgi:hypothetical protein
MYYRRVLYSVPMFGHDSLFPGRSWLQRYFAPKTRK